MYRTKITYTDYNGDKQTDELYFNLSKPELAKLQFSVKEGMDAKIAEVRKNKDVAQMYQIFSGFVEKSYGIKSDDGKRFVKSPEMTKDFLQSAAYDAYMYKLMMDPSEMNAFTSAVFPDVDELVANNPKAKAQVDKRIKELGLQRKDE